MCKIYRSGLRRSRKRIVFNKLNKRKIVYIYNRQYTNTYDHSPAKKKYINLNIEEKKEDIVVTVKRNYLVEEEYEFIMIYVYINNEWHVR